MNRLERVEAAQIEREPADVLRLNPENPFPHAMLASIYSLSDRESEARAAMAHALRLDPTGLIP